MTANTKKITGKKNPAKEVKSKPIFKERLIRFITITIVPLILILLIEVMLRLLGYGTSSKFVFKEKISGELCYVPNDDYTQKYFGRDMGRSTAAFAIPVTKRPNTFRIFVLGSSAAKGDPAPAYSMSEILKVFLKDNYPEVNFEIINVGMTAINSHVVYDVAKECSKLDPDMFIIYEGNNEVVGPFGPGTVFSPLLSNISLIRTIAALKATRIGQFYSDIFSSATNKPKEWGGMEMFLDKKVYAESPDLQIVYKHFQRNMNDICKLVKEKNIPLIVSSVGVNLRDCAPFEGRSRKLSPANAQKISEINEMGPKLESIGKYRQALDLYSEGLIIDSLSADLWFKIADCYFHLGEYSPARECYKKSMDLDALRFRADSKINEIIKRISKNNEEKKIYFAPAEDSLIINSQNGIMGNDLFYDHVHLRFEGNYLVARSLFMQVTKTDLLKKYKRSEKLPGLKDCQRKLGFTGWDRYKLCQDMISRYSRPPFTNQINHEKTIKFLEEELKTEDIYTKKDSFSGISAIYDYSLEYDPANWLVYLRFADFLQEAEMNYSRARRLLMEVNKIIDHPSINSELGNLSVKEGRYNDAIGYYNKVVDKLPKSEAAYGNLALGYSLSGNFEKALINYQKALRLSPNYKNVHFGIAGVYLKQGKYAEALAENRREIKINSLSPQVYEQLGQIYEKIDSTEKSEKAYQLAFQLDPYNIDYNKEWAEVLTKLGRYEESVVHYKFIALKKDTDAQANIDCGNALTRSGNFKDAAYWYLKAIKTEPVNYACFNNLGNIYMQLQKTDSAVSFYKKAIELKNNLPGFHVNLGMAYLNIPDFNRAIESFNNALAIDSNFYAAHIGKGAVFDYRSEPDLAEAEYRKAIKLEPNNGIGYKKLGLILINKNDYENAITISNKALELLPSDDDVENMVSLAYFKYGNYLYQQSKYHEAITNLEKAVEYTPNNSNPKVALAWAYYKQAYVEMSRNNSAAGMSQLENAVKIFPEFVEANYNLGIIYLQQNNAAEAYKYIKQVYTLNPKYQQVAAIYEKLKEGQP